MLTQQSRRRAIVQKRSNTITGRSRVVQETKMSMLIRSAQIFPEEKLRIILAKTPLPRAQMISFLNGLSKKQRTAIFELYKHLDSIPRRQMLSKTYPNLEELVQIEATTKYTSRKIN